MQSRRFDESSVNVGKQWRGSGVGYFPTSEGFRRFAGTYQLALDLLPTPTDSSEVSTSFGRVHAYRFGPVTDDPPIVLMPGRQSSTPLWRSNIALLARTRTVISLDGLGEPGRSCQTQPFTSDADQAQYLDETLGQLGIEQAHLLGVSIGGWLAVQTAIHRPERISSVIALDPANTFAPLTWKMIVVSLGNVIPGMPESVRFRLLSWISGGADASGEAEGRLVASGMRDFVVRFPAPTRPSDEALSSIDIPVLALIAGRSIVHNPTRAADRARRLLRFGEVDYWPDATHAINGEFPERIAAKVDGFLSRLDR